MRSLVDKVRGACRAYRRAFGERPNVVHVNPLDVLGSDFTVEEFDGRMSVVSDLEERLGIVVLLDKACLRHHYFAVREEKVGQKAECEA